MSILGEKKKSSKEGRKPSLNQYKKEDKNIYNKSWYQHNYEKWKLFTKFTQNYSTLVWRRTDSEKPSLIKIQEIFKFKFKHIEKNPAFVMIIFSETSFQYCSILSSIVSKIMKQRSKKIIDLLKEGQKNNEIRNDVEA